MSACNLRPPEQQLITASARGSALEAKNDFAERSLYKTEKSRNHFLRPAPAAAFSNLRQRAFANAMQRPGNFWNFAPLAHPLLWPKYSDEFRARDKRNLHRT